MSLANIIMLNYTSPGPRGGDK